MTSRTDSLGFLLADASRLMRRAFENRMANHGLTLAQARALVHVSRHEGVRQVDLAELLEIQPISLTRLIDQLAEAGLVERRPEPADRRAYQIHLTAAAAEPLATIKRIGGQIADQALQGLDAQTKTQICKALTLMRDNLAR